MRSGRVFLGVASAALLAMAAGCGSTSSGSKAATTEPPAAGTQAPGATTGGSPAAGGTTPDPCSLLSDADVDAGFALSDLNSKIVSVTRTPNVITPDTSMCDFGWKAANDSSSSFGLYVYPASIYEALKSAPASQTVPEIPGAYETPDGYFVAAGKVTLSITGVVSVEASGKLLQEAAAKVGG